MGAAEPNCSGSKKSRRHVGLSRTIGTESIRLTYHVDEQDLPSGWEGFASFVTKIARTIRQHQRSSSKRASNRAAHGEGVHRQFVARRTGYSAPRISQRGRLRRRSAIASAGRPSALTTTNRG